MPSPSSAEISPKAITAQSSTGARNIWRDRTFCGRHQDRSAPATSGRPAATGVRAGTLRNFAAQEIEAAAEHDDRREVEQRPDDLQRHAAIVPEMQWTRHEQCLDIERHVPGLAKRAVIGVDQHRPEQPRGQRLVAARDRHRHDGRRQIRRTGHRNGLHLHARRMRERGIDRALRRRQVSAAPARCAMAPAWRTSSVALPMLRRICVDSVLMTPVTPTTTVQARTTIPSRLCRSSQYRRRRGLMVPNSSRRMNGP